MFQRNRRGRRSMSRETTFSSVPNQVFEENHEECLGVNLQQSTLHLGEREMEKLCKEIHDSGLRIIEQEEALKQRHEQLQKKRLIAKKDLKGLFRELRDILIDKEKECMVRVDYAYQNIEGRVAEILDRIGCTRKLIEDVLELGNDVSEEVVKAMHRDLSAGLDNQELEIERLQAPAINVSSSVVLDMKRLKVLDTERCGDDVGANTSGASGSSTHYPEMDLERLPSTGGDAAGNSQNQPEAEYSNQSRRSGNEVMEHQRDQMETEGAFGFIHNHQITVPNPEGENNTNTAPPNEEAPPPPYWQAVGLSGPTRSTEHPPFNRVATFGNRLEFWNCFPLRRQYDVKTPMIVSVTWNGQRICVADRANKKIKFFYQSGQMITEMRFGDCEIHSVAFLEENDGEARYVVSVPKTNTLLIICIENDTSTSLLQKLVLKQRYTSISKGPREQTLAGANALPKDGLARIDIFNFDGDVIQTFTQTPKCVCFLYPKSIAVFENAIIICDWKLNLVAVFLEDGTKVGQYTGTPSTPLVKPLDVTVNPFGHIFIVDGQFSNIHIIDLVCTPVRIIKVPKGERETSQPKLASYDCESHRLAVVRSTGDLAIFSFVEDDNVGVAEEGIVLPPSSCQPEVFPYTDVAMLEHFGARPRSRHQTTFIL